MKKSNILLFCLLLSSPSLTFSKNKCLQSVEQKSISSRVKCAINQTRKTIGNLSELTGGLLALGYSIMMLAPGKSHGTLYHLREGNKVCIGLYAANTIITLSLIANGLEGLQEQYDIKGVSVNAVKRMYSAIVGKNKKAKKV